jgi:hypothetical protein
MSMKLKKLCSLLVALFCVFPTFHALADSPVTFEILANIDYPGSQSTYAIGVNDANDVVGEFDINTTGPAFIRFHNGHFSAPIVDPNDGEQATELTGINNFQIACGDYQDGFTQSFGFVLSGVGTFTPFNIAGATSTYMGGINDAGNLCGGSFPTEAWVSIDGVVSTFTVPNSLSSGALGINNLNQCVGFYVAHGGSNHGFMRDADGTLVYPIDARNATSTALFGINDRGDMVGSITDRTGDHGVFFPSRNRNATFDYPGALVTRFNGINSQGVIVGSYYGPDGLYHSFLVRVRLPSAE